MSAPHTNDTATPASAPPPGSRHWRNTRAITILLLCTWFGGTFSIGFFARDLERIHFLGWPLSYYMGAQGSLLLFLLIIGTYALAMRRLDRIAEAQAAMAEQR